ncbi:FxsA family protein [Cohnella lubricantis]|uniref:FxsA family protein n=1 Tax=Cohnella lubricantis TaxID=2163172 RepID=A0A841T7E7_9BACL|nr:FxsA family protein [Cohnella lubricantis]
MQRKAGLIVLVAIAAELAGIIAMSYWIGGWATFGLLLLGAVLGVYLGMTLGRRHWERAKSQLREGQPPGRAVLDGVCILAGCLLLAIPGFLSDIAGLTLLLPFIRPLYRAGLYVWLEKKFRSGSFPIFRWPGR